MLYLLNSKYLIYYLIQFHIFIHYPGRIAGIEPASSPWQREILPFDHIRIIYNLYSISNILYINK